MPIRESVETVDRPLNPSWVREGGNAATQAAADAPGPMVAKGRDPTVEDGTIDHDVVRCGDLSIVRGFDRTLAANGLDSLRALFELRSAESLDKPGLEPWRERLRVNVESPNGSCTMYLKRFCHPPAAARRALLRSSTRARSTAELEWIWMRRLAATEIPCVRPVAYGHQLRGRRELRSAVLMQEVPGRSLEWWMGKWMPTDHIRVQSLIKPLADLVSRFHAAGYVHRDLYLSHVFYDPSRPAPDSLCLIDVQRVMLPRWRRRRWVIKDLAALNFSTPVGLVSRTDRLRWLKLYLGRDEVHGPVRQLIYAITAKSRSIARHERRRRRELAGRSTSE